MGEAKRRKAAKKGIAPDGNYFAVNGNGEQIDPSYAIFPIIRQHADITSHEVKN